MKIGIIGGGQLGKMMILEAKKMGLYVTVLDPAKSCPCHSICDDHIVAAFDDAQAVNRLAAKSDVVTYEFEHIEAAPLLELEAAGAKIYPTAKSLKIIQDKFTQKQALKEAGAPVGEFCSAAAGEKEIAACGERFGYPLMLKARTGGYDGKGNYLLKTEGGIGAALTALNAGKVPLMAEKFVDFEMEISVLACRTAGGEVSVYPVGQNNHADSILSETKVPAGITDATMGLALAAARQVMEVFGGVGMFCTEMFVLKNGGVLINEVAPRPHNSGHYSIEGCVTSQFENHIRAVCGLPLGDTSLLRPSVMRNILGSGQNKGPAVVDGLERALAVKGAKVHIYGKEESAPKRKMGHLTVTAGSLQEASELAGLAWSEIKIY